MKTYIIEGHNSCSKHMVKSASILIKDQVIEVNGENYKLPILHEFNTLKEAQEYFNEYEVFETQVYTQDDTVYWSNEDFIFKHPHGEVTKKYYSHVQKEHPVKANEPLYKIPYHNGIKGYYQPPTRKAVALYFKYRTNWQNHYYQPVKTTLITDVGKEFTTGILGTQSAIEVIVGYLK